MALRVICWPVPCHLMFSQKSKCSLWLAQQWASGDEPRVHLFREHFTLLEGKTIWSCCISQQKMHCQLSYTQIFEESCFCLIVPFCLMPSGGFTTVSSAEMRFLPVTGSSVHTDQCLKTPNLPLPKCSIKCFVSQDVLILCGYVHLFV